MSVRCFRVENSDIARIIVVDGCTLSRVISNPENPGDKSDGMAVGWIVLDSQIHLRYQERC